MEVFRQDILDKIKKNEQGNYECPFGCKKESKSKSTILQHIARMKKCSETPTRTKKPKDNLVIQYPIDPIIINFD